MLSRLIYAAGNVMGFALITTTLTFTLGTFMGLLAATLGGWIDQAISRIIDVFISVPMLIFSLLLLTIFGTSIVAVILIIAVLVSTRVFRLARAVAVDVTVQDFFEVAQARGESLWWLIRREVLPNVLTSSHWSEQKLLTLVSTVCRTLANYGEHWFPCSEADPLKSRYPARLLQRSCSLLSESRSPHRVISGRRREASFLSALFLCPITLIRNRAIATAVTGP